MCEPYYVVLTGAKKNVGDFLITQRCENLLEKIRPDRKLIKLNGWESLENSLNLINNSKALILMGGPGYHRNMYPCVYPLVENLDRITVPIIPMGLGIKDAYASFGSIERYKFTKESLRLLHKMSQESSLSCRDYISKKILLSNGIPNVTMTGCPVWYSVEDIGREFKRVEKITKVVFTPAQNDMFAQQSVDVMTYLRNKFPEAIIYCSFHRGIGTKDSFTQDWDVKNTNYLAKQAEAIGLIPVDTAFSVEKINFYDECTLHIGYRVHAHVYFLSKRKASILLNEDARGIGMCQALSCDSINAFNVSALAERQLMAKNTLVRKTIGLLAKICGGKIKTNKNIIQMLDDSLNGDLENDFIRLSGTSTVIDNNYELMKEFLLKMP